MLSNEEMAAGPSGNRKCGNLLGKCPKNQAEPISDHCDPAAIGPGRSRRRGGAGVAGPPLATPRIHSKILHAFKHCG